MMRRFLSQHRLFTIKVFLAVPGVALAAAGCGSSVGLIALKNIYIYKIGK